MMVRDNDVWAIFQASIDSLNLHEDHQAAMLADAREALLSWGAKKNAYEALIATRWSVTAKGRGRRVMAHGVCPEGEAYYRGFFAPGSISPPPPISPQARLHELGLANVARIHGEMREIMDEVGV